MHTENAVFRCLFFLTCAALTPLQIFGTPPNQEEEKPWIVFEPSPVVKPKVEAGDGGMCGCDELSSPEAYLRMANYSVGGALVSAVSTVVARHVCPVLVGPCLCTSVWSLSVGAMYGAQGLEQVLKELRDRAANGDEQSAT